MSLKEVNKKIEAAVTGGYKKIEDGVVSGYKKIEDKFIDTFLAEARERILKSTKGGQDE